MRRMQQLPLSRWRLTEKRKQDTVPTTEEARRDASTLQNEADEEGFKFIE